MGLWTLASSSSPPPCSLLLLLRLLLLRLLSCLVEVEAKDASASQFLRTQMNRYNAILWKHTDVSEHVTEDLNERHTGCRPHCGTLIHVRQKGFSQLTSEGNASLRTHTLSPSIHHPQSEEENSFSVVL
eukprot:748354-Hanusia_phi.AAC.2